MFEKIKGLFKKKGKTEVVSIKLDTKALEKKLDTVIKLLTKPKPTQLVETSVSLGSQTLNHVRGTPTEIVAKIEEYQRGRVWGSEFFIEGYFFDSSQNEGVVILRYRTTAR